MFEIDFSYKTTGFPVRDEEIKFETYRFYLRCLVDFIDDTYGGFNNLSLAVLDYSKRFQRFKNFDKEWVERFLKIAWNTEYIANLNQQEDIELIRINNQWKPIQIYYAVYSAAEAFCYLLDGDKADSHRKCLTKVSSFLIKTKFVPWNFAYQGARGKTCRDHTPINFPAGTVPLHNLARRSVNAADMIATCLKAEHYKRIDDEFRKQKGYYKYQFDPGYTTSLNFLYRLRIKSNYKEVDIFLAEAPDKMIVEFSDDLSKICFHTLLLLEVFIMAKVGPKEFLSMAEAFLKLNRRAENLTRRKKFYSQAA